MKKSPTQNNVVFISGGAKGIGASVARAFHGAGYTVVVNYRTSRVKAEQLEKEINALGGHMVLMQGDLRSASVRASIAKKVRSLFPGGINVLVNNAGVYDKQPFEQVSEKAFDASLDSNLKTAVFLTQSLLPSLKKKRGSSVIFIGSGGSFSYTKASACFSYAVAKSALIGVTRALAVELAPTIRVNCIVPTYIKTDMLTALSKSEVQMKAERTLLKKIGMPEDVSSIVRFVASPDAGYITGQCFHVNGGRYLG